MLAGELDEEEEDDADEDDHMTAALSEKRPKGANSRSVESVSS